MPTTVENGFSACAGASRAGWYGGVLVLEDRDADFIDVPEQAAYAQRAFHCRHWCRVTVSAAKSCPKG